MGCNNVLPEFWTKSVELRQLIMARDDIFSKTVWGSWAYGSQEAMAVYAQALTLNEDGR
jgi:hypothetical protein